MATTGGGLVIFDDGLGVLGPMTDLRPASEVRTGALTTRERLERALGDVATAAGETVAVNGRCVPAPTRAEIDALPRGGAMVERDSGQVVAARLGAAEWEAFARDGALPAGVQRLEVGEQRLLHRPWDVIRSRDAAIAFDLAMLAAAPTQGLPDGVVAIGDNDLTIDPSAVVYPTATFDLEHGPVVIAEGATVRPRAIVVGPAYIGPGSTVVDRAHIKANTAIGPMCKFGGEVGGTIVQGFSNKSHDGHLGDAWVGEWVNLGAGTVNSNLLNTYGEVTARAHAGAPNERTGLTFYGCVLGDHVKTAIGTRIMTGACVGTGTMWAANAAITGAVGAFRWVTDAGDRPYAFEKCLETARAMMGRRKVTPSDAYVSAMRAAHAAASAGR